MSTPLQAGKPRVALIGPVLPFRGGIAQYTTQLRRALARICDLYTVSYRRQYPAWLYPGKSDREPNHATHREPDVDYSLDCLNPFSWRRSVHTIANQGCTLAVFDWWTLFWAPAIALMAYGLHRRGVRIAFICHNLSGHDTGPFKRKLARFLLSRADAYLVHSSEQAALLRATFPGKTIAQHVHPLYDQYPIATTTAAGRGRLELLFFGFIRPYKGLDVLIDALAQLNDVHVYLTVVGEPWIAPGELTQRIAAKQAPNVELHLDYVSAESVAGYFARADLVVLPYLAASGSGVAAMAMHYERPILATRTGAFPDVIEEGVTGFLVEAGSATELARTIRTVTREQLAAMRQCIHARKPRFSWESLAECLLALTPQPASTRPAQQSVPRHPH
jgi:glycosyltransferase involved in cell wall biosynthesis